MPRYADPGGAPPVPAVAPRASAVPAQGANGSAPHAAANGAPGSNGVNGANGVHLNGAANGSAPATHAAAPAAVNGSVKAKDRAGTELSRDKLTDMLLAIVEEKTGYPRDMVGLDQSLESDLGIDSIKRIEVVGAMLQCAA